MYAYSHDHEVAVSFTTSIVKRYIDKLQILLYIYNNNNVLTLAGITYTDIFSQYIYYIYIYIYNL